jgi:hypothetical protein
VLRALGHVGMLLVSLGAHYLGVGALVSATV